jgi:hypothetical protein
MKVGRAATVVLADFSFRFLKADSAQLTQSFSRLNQYNRKQGVATEIGR